MFHEFGNDPGVLWLRFGRPGAFPARSLLNFNAKISPPRQVVLAPCLLTPTSYTILRPIGQSVAACCGILGRESRPVVTYWAERRVLGRVSRPGVTYWAESCALLWHIGQSVALFQLCDVSKHVVYIYV